MPAREGYGGSKIGRKEVPIPCAWCGQMTLERVKSQPHATEDGVVEMRVYACEPCGEGKNTITIERYWLSGRWPQRYFAAERRILPGRPIEKGKP